jgi:hypothetical protein
MPSGAAPRVPGFGAAAIAGSRDGDDRAFVDGGEDRCDRPIDRIARMVVTRG